MPKITFKSQNNTQTVDAINGDTLLETAKKNNVPLYGGCDGAGICGSCHIFIDPDYIDKINEKSMEELDLLDILPNGCMQSRLACQVIVSDELDGMTVTIP